MGSRDRFLRTTALVAVLAALPLGRGAAPALADCPKPKTSNLDVQAFAEEVIDRYGDYGWQDDLNASQDPGISGLDILSPEAMVEKGFRARKIAFCQRNEYGINESLSSADHENRIAFDNPPGSFDTGLCWWHSRLQRSLSYLANFRPGAEKPGPKKVQEILRHLSNMDEVVEIPGYRDIASFTKAHQKEITAFLDAWTFSNTIDGTSAQRLADKGTQDPGTLRKMMDQLASRMQRKRRLIFQRLAQPDGNPFASHAWLVTDITQLRDTRSTHADISGGAVVGYQLNVVDSNYPGQKIKVEYHYGESALQYCPIKADMTPDCETLVPYTALDDDLRAIDHSIRDYCATP